MKHYLTFTAAIGLLLVLSGEIVAGGRRGAPGNNIRRYWGPSVPVRPHYPYYSRYGYYPYPPHGFNPRSVIIITPSTHYPYYGPGTVVTSEPFYCHMHHVGFVSRVGFLDHVSGTHKIPLQTVNAICAEGEESCVVEGY